MLTNQKLQNALVEIKEISKLDTILFDSKGKEVASTMDAAGALEAIVADFIGTVAEFQAYGKFHLFKIKVEMELEYVLVTTKVDDASLTLGRMAACQIRTLVQSSMEQYDKNNFIQNVLLGNMLIVDVFSKAKKLHIEPSERVVYVIDTGNKQNDEAMEMVKNLSDLKTKDFVTSVDEHSLILVKDIHNIPEENREEELENFAKLLVDMLQMEAMIKVRVGYGNIVNQIPEIASSFQEAKMALEVGRVFYAENDTISYTKLGIGRLIYQLPMSLCEMFIKEVFGDTIPDVFEDEEAMSTIAKFFENDLNISETARQLYVHRNTLVYRLERIEKSIGLDIRKFDDAMTFRIAMMVLSHMRNQGK